MVRGLLVYSVLKTMVQLHWHWIYRQSSVKTLLTFQVNYFSFQNVSFPQQKCVIRKEQKSLVFLKGKLGHVQTRKHRCSLSKIA